MIPQYDLEKIKFGIDNGTWSKALGLYEGGKLKNFQVVKLLIEFTKINPQCTKEFELLSGKETSFGWEEPLLNLVTSQQN